MKRIIFAVIGCMAILSLAACSGNNTSDNVDISSSAVTDSSSDISAPTNSMENSSEQSTASNEEQNSSFTEESTNSGEKSKITEIRIAIGETVVTAKLNDSETSRDFIALLPLTLNMTRFYDREYAGSLSSAELSQNGEAIDDFENGDVTYYVAGNALAIFFDKADEYDQGGLIRIGKITSALSEIINMSGNAEVTITLSEVESNMNYDFSKINNVELINADLDSMDVEQLSVLYQLARYCRAMTEADIETMREITSEDMTFTHMSGRKQTREEYFADVKDGSLDYFTIGIDTPVVEVNGNSATVTYTSVLNANAYGAEGTYRMHGTHYYEKRNGNWIAVNRPNN
ncbi:MAG: DUF4440 domain-containing protein [Oscillospiraceae bacterium]|nr:DUF4440 domain-containing protein [Oscillospiraceae bacterium]